MAWNDLKAAVAAVIETNGNQEITGALLQSTLNSIIDQVGANASYKGVAIPSTSPGSPDGPVFYIASTQGTYANFGGFVLDGGFAVLSNVTGSWAGTKFLKTEMDAKADHGYESNPKTLKEVDDSLVQLANDVDLSGHAITIELDKKINTIEIIQGNNLYDYTKDIEGYYILSSTGMLFENTTSSCSNLIYVQGIEKIIIKNRLGTTGYRFINLNNEPLKALKIDGSEFANFCDAMNDVELYVPNNAIYFQINTKLNNITSKEEISVSDGKTLSIKEELVSNNTDIVRLKAINNEVFRKGGYNLYNGDIIEGFYLTAGGVIGAYNNSSVTDIIPVKPNHYYYLSSRKQAGSRGIRCLSADQETHSKVLSPLTNQEYQNYYLPNDDATDGLFNGGFKTSPSAAYIQIGLRFSDANATDYDKIMLEDVGDVYNPDFVPHPYEEYNENLILKESALPPIDLPVIPEAKKSVKILCFGNSFTQNSFGYVPKIINSIDENINATIAIAYIGGSPLAQHLANFIQEPQNVEGTIYGIQPYTYQKNINNEGWISESNASIDFMLNDEKWDIITFQQAGGTSEKDWGIYYAPYIYKLHKTLFDKLNYSLNIGWVMIHGAYANSDESFLTKWEGTAENSRKVMDKTGATILFPYGTAMQNARTTSLKNLGEGSAKNLTTDNSHIQAGIGEMVASLSNSLTILNFLGCNVTGLIGNAFRAIEGDGIVSSEVIGVSDDNSYLAQVAAVCAFKNPYEVTNMSSVEDVMVD